MDPIEPFITAFESIRSAKSRSFLTTLGILIAVAAVIIDVSIGAGYTEYLEESFEQAGATLIFIEPQKAGALQHRELVAIRDIPGVVAASPVQDKGVRITYMSEIGLVGVYGVTKEYQQLQNLELEEGNFLSDQDRYAAVVGYDIAHGKFSRDISVQSPIEIRVTRSNGEERTATFLVKGIIKKRTVSGMASELNELLPDKRVFIPESMLNEMLNVSGYSIFASAESMEGVGDVKNEIKDRLDRLLGVSQNLRVPRPYKITTLKQFLKQAEKQMGMFSNMLTVVALVSLLVGAIGIMNIMLVTVTERTREVGLMKAVGATKFDVLITFLVESGMLGLIGGLLGVALSIGLCRLICLFHFSFLPTPIVPIDWVFIGLGVAVAVGIVSGLYPAYRAASMSPLEALRHE